MGVLEDVITLLDALTSENADGVSHALALFSKKVAEAKRGSQRQTIRNDGVFVE